MLRSPKYGVHASLKLHRILLNGASAALGYEHVSASSLGIPNSDHRTLVETNSTAVKLWSQSSAYFKVLLYVGHPWNFVLIRTSRKD